MEEVQPAATTSRDRCRQLDEMEMPRVGAGPFVEEWADCDGDVTAVSNRSGIEPDGYRALSDEFSCCGVCEAVSGRGVVCCDEEIVTAVVDASKDLRYWTPHSDIGCHVCRGLRIGNQAQLAQPGGHRGLVGHGGAVPGPGPTPGDHVKQRQLERTRQAEYGCTRQ